jgi:peptide/nickel transport system substrate-binding protein
VGGRRPAAVAALLAGVILVSSCGPIWKGRSSGGAKKGSGLLVLGVAGDPITLDPALVDTDDSLRIAAQIFETLVSVSPGGSLASGLAKSWSGSVDGLSWTFNLQPGVRFHDDTAFDAKALCFNFDRWLKLKGPRLSDISLFKSCAVKDAATAVLHLTRPSASFLAGLAVPAFAMVSPAAVARYGPEFGLKHPVGTGPFKFESFVPNDKVVVVRNDSYWARKAKLANVVFKPIPDRDARRRALETGEIAGYEDVPQADVPSLQAAGAQIVPRPPLNVSYLGMNQARAPLDNVKVREAVAYALETKIKEFIPSSVTGWTADVATYDHDIAKAKALLAGAKLEAPSVELSYPVDRVVSATTIKANLETAGFKVVAKPLAAPDFTQYRDSGKAQLYLSEVSSSVADPDAFLRPLFGGRTPAWGFDNPAIFRAIDAARAEPDPARRMKLYQQANKIIMDFLPGVPYAQTPTLVALSPRVHGFLPTPSPFETFSTVTIS